MKMFVVASAFAAFLLVIPCVDAQVYGRLMNGTAPWNGRLEMFYKSSWRKVCGYGFRKQEAQVACRMMGFNTSQVFAVDTKSFEFKEIYLYLDGLRCTGEETSLENCYHLWFSVDTYCSGVAGITCNTEHTGLRFKDIQDMTPNRGLVQVDIGDGHWETLCVSSNITASVVCRHLGLPS
ncbi:deleted in malignant brain tumors 1 protein-like [Pomacea canaliculata]|uniref:deleted in malignant brain tumors 1 protein-like n=1 Tax=Pomacea canaliculata TaxID=400727 RepID=UPI000D73BF5A|nr:deleted in malignant brain tumors 1 protein-like [Pomacea canaliculata]